MGVLTAENGKKAGNQYDLLLDEDNSFKLYEECLYSYGERQVRQEQYISCPLKHVKYKDGQEQDKSSNPDRLTSDS